ncbi:MAG TPA: phosphatase PAP2 family protein [Ktedonobacteraceae bacterium]|jgi:membrane-associated phospholipid phosphatase|nr:phosphatase PAP2 family protein [Ktedonobacteraceae bacterium]
MEVSQEKKPQGEEKVVYRADDRVTAFSVHGGVQNHRHRYWLVVGILLWLLAVAGMIALSLFVHALRQPLPFELNISREIQASMTVPWIGAMFRFLTWINDPLPDTVTVIVVLAIFVAFRWIRQGIFFALSVVIGNGVDALIGDVVQRPRPTPNLIHVDSRLIFNSFPSGHSCHMMVFYGFLLFLTSTRAVREWRYHWMVLVLQIWALLNICLIGIARLWEGEHWILDVLGGYLDGLIWVSFFIFLYLLVTNKTQNRRRE